MHFQNLLLNVFNRLPNDTVILALKAFLILCTVTGKAVDLAHGYFSPIVTLAFEPPVTSITVRREDVHLLN